MASCKFEKWKWKAFKHHLSFSTWPVAKLKSESETPPSTNYPFQPGQLQNWKWKAFKHQSSASIWPVAKKSESEKPQHSNFPLQHGQLQIWKRDPFIHFIMASWNGKFEKWKWRPPSTNYLFQTFCYFAHRPGLFLLLSLSQSSIWRYEKPTKGNASGNSLLFHHLGHPYWGLSFHVCHKLPAALVPIHDLIRALIYDQPTWSLRYISLFLGCW